MAFTLKKQNLAEELNKPAAFIFNKTVLSQILNKCLQLRKIENR